MVAELIGKLQRVTRELKEDVMKHTEELRSVHEAAAVSCSSQLEMIDNIRGRCPSERRLLRPMRPASEYLVADLQGIQQP
eukprot:7031280-Pyramimonas_sp.AAC.1